MMVSQWYLWVEPHQLFRQFTIYVEETKSAITLYQHVIQTLEHVTIAIMVMTEGGFIKHVGNTAMCVELMDCVFLEEVCYDIQKSGGNQNFLFFKLL